MSEPRLTIKPGVTINAGVTLNGYIPTSLTITSDMLTNGGVEAGSFNFVGMGGNPTGFTITDPTNTGVMLAFANATSLWAAISNTGYDQGYIWTANWAAGSTTLTTPVVMYVGEAGNYSVVFYVLDPTDSTYATGLAGTFNFPVTFTATSTLDTSPTPG